ncbi:MAG: hypothetical protein Q9188_002030 [Gyalolechia gomerana]
MLISEPRWQLFVVQKLSAGRVHHGGLDPLIGTLVSSQKSLMATIHRLSGLVFHSSPSSLFLRSLFFVKNSRAMRTLLVLFHLLLYSFPVLIFRTAIAKPIDLPWQSTDQLDAIAVRNPNPLHINALPVHSLSKRAPPTLLPGGAYCIFEEHYVSFSNIPAAARYLQIFYHFALEALEQPRYAGLRTLVLCIQGGPFELYFRPHGNNPNLPVPLFMVKQFLALMLRRAERGWAMKYSGAVHEPDGAVFEMVLQLAGPVATSILDSAMDMYGS